HRVNVYQHADAGNEQQPDAGKRIEQKAGISLKRGGAAVMQPVGQISGIAAEPSVENGLIGSVKVAWLGRPGRVLQYCSAGEEERQHDRADTDRAHRRLLQLSTAAKHER